MTGRTTPPSWLRTRRAFDSCVYGAAIAVSGCTAGGLEPSTSGETDPTKAVASAGVPLADYDAHLERIRAGDCFGLGAHVGTRGSCLVIIESHIDNARESYYDAQTKGLVAEYTYDPMSDIEAWTVGYSDCAADPFVEVEFILCGR